jgi:hypothetical protein
VSDNLREPRKHTKLFDEMALQLIGGDDQLKKLIGEVNALMYKYALSPSEIQRVVRYVCERNNWSAYAIRQGGPKQPEAQPWSDDDDGDEADLI